VAKYTETFGLNTLASASITAQQETRHLSELNKVATRNSSIPIPTKHHLTPFTLRKPW
jgi:hypothetical protein